MRDPLMSLESILTQSQLSSLSPKEEGKRDGGIPGTAAGQFAMSPESPLGGSDQKKLIDEIELIIKMLEALEDSGGLTPKQKSRLDKMRKQLADRLLKKQKKNLETLAGHLKGSGTIVTAADKKKWNTERNVQDLAQIIQSESSTSTSAAQSAVGYVVLNRMKRNGAGSVSGVAGGFAHNQSPTPAFVNLARNILSCKVADNSGGATHFYSPRSMPKKGEDTSGYDTRGGLENVPGVGAPNFRPGWSVQFPPVNVPGVPPADFKFFKQPGSGHVR